MSGMDFSAKRKQAYSRMFCILDRMRFCVRRDGYALSTGTLFSILFCGMLVLYHGILAFVAILMPLSRPVVREDKEDDDDGRGGDDTLLLRHGTLVLAAILMPLSLSEVIGAQEEEEEDGDDGLEGDVEDEVLN